VDGVGDGVGDCVVDGVVGDGEGNGVEESDANETKARSRRT